VIPSQRTHLAEDEDVGGVTGASRGKFVAHPLSFILGDRIGATGL